MASKNSKKDTREIVIMSLGGSIVCPNSPDVTYLKKLKKTLLKHLDERRFILIIGGGKIARKYMAAGDKIVDLKSEEKDWIGIYATRLNASLVRAIFKDKAHPKIIENPTKKINFKEDIMVAAGYLPGCSTDYDAVLLAKNFNVKTIINMSNIDYVYDKDPKKFKNVKPLKDLKWKELLKMTGHEFKPGLNAPFDPIAAKEAMKMGLNVLSVHGKKLENLDKVLYGEIFEGTLIQ
jgi:uridylate kinase